MTARWRLQGKTLNANSSVIVVWIHFWYATEAICLKNNDLIHNKQYRCYDAKSHRNANSKLSQLNFITWKGLFGCHALPKAALSADVSLLGAFAALAAALVAG
jgi:hypothetical protein